MLRQLDQAVVGGAEEDLREKRESLKNAREKEKVELEMPRENPLEREEDHGEKDSVRLRSVQELEAGFVERATVDSACLTRAALSVTTGGTVLKRRRSWQG